MEQRDIKPNTFVYGLIQTPHSSKYKSVALNCFFLSSIDALGLQEYLRDRGDNIYYTTLKATYKDIFENGVINNNQKPLLFGNLQEYFNYSMQEDQIM